MNIRKFIYLCMMTAVLGTAVSSCDKEDDDTDIILGGDGSNPIIGGDDNDDDDQPVLTGVKARLEVPKLKDENIFIEHSSNNIMTYCLEFEPKAYHSRWVAFRFDSKTRGLGAGRNEDWSDDPELPSQYRIGTSGFGSGYDRGHICASHDRQYSVAANKQTFYMTNMSPQMSRFNQDYWTGFEGKVQSWGRDKSFADTLYVVKGGTVNETIGTIRRNGHDMVVPKYYFMALLKCKNNTYSALGFWMEHKDYNIVNPSLSEMAKRIVTIDQLEELTGIDFFHNLPDNVETKVESQVSNSAWGF